MIIIQKPLVTQGSDFPPQCLRRTCVSSSAHAAAFIMLCSIFSLLHAHWIDSLITAQAYYTLSPRSMHSQLFNVYILSNHSSPRPIPRIALSSPMPIPSLHEMTFHCRITCFQFTLNHSNPMPAYIYLSICSICSDQSGQLHPPPGEHHMCTVYPENQRARLRSLQDEHQVGGHYCIPTDYCFYHRKHRNSN